MRKALSYLAAAIVSMGAVGAWAADRGVVGMEWAFGPVKSLNGAFGGPARFDNEANLYWRATDDFTLGVFGGSAMWGAKKSQLDVNATGGNSVVSLLQKEGMAQTSGIRLLKTLPMMNMLSVGLDLGAAQLTQTSARITRDRLAVPGGAGGNTVTVPATFGLATAGAQTAAANSGGVLYPDADIPMTTTAAVMGLTGRLVLLQAASKTITTEFSLTASLRYAVFTPTYALGTTMDREGAVYSNPAQPSGYSYANDTPSSVTPFLLPSTMIKPVSNYDNLVITLGANIWF